MLWKKENIRKDAPLVDLLQKYDYDFIFRKLDESTESSKTKKSDKNYELTQHYRKKGKIEMDANNWTDAIELINQALCFAKNRSDKMGLCFADRAECFLNLKMYEQCFVDIKLAKANNCPTNFQSRLKKWTDECKKMLKLSDKQHEMDEPKLSFDASKQCPNIANVIRIESENVHDQQHQQRCIIATQDIGVGMFKHEKTLPIN